MRGEWQSLCYFEDKTMNFGELECINKPFRTKGCGIFSNIWMKYFVISDLSRLQFTRYTDAWARTVLRHLRRLSAVSE